jgi:hypothetical protein
MYIDIDIDLDIDIDICKDIPIYSYSIVCFSLFFYFLVLAS